MSIKRTRISGIYLWIYLQPTALACIACPQRQGQEALWNDET